MKPLLKVILFTLLVFQSETFAQGVAKAETPASAAATAVTNAASDFFPTNHFLLIPQRWENKSIIFANKKLRKLFVYKILQGKPVSIFETEADFGRKGGVKAKRDDKKTPEGIYFPQEQLTPPTIPFNTYGNRAFTLDYPNYFDRVEGRTGSGIWIHSVPENVPLTRGSKGCVVVRNKSIDELKKLINLKDTPVVIDSPSDEATEATEGKELASFLEDWKNAWASKDLDKYIEFYSEKFKAQKYTKKTWKEYKSRVNEGAGDISIVFEDPSALRAHNQYLVSFIQKYKSEKLQDVGIKTLYIRREDSKFKILREDWGAIGSDALLGSADSTGDKEN